VSQPATTTHAHALPAAAASRRAWLRSRRAREADPALVFTLKAVIGSRLIVWAGALLGIGLIGRNLQTIAAKDPSHYTQPFSSAALNLLFAPAARWDSVWYLEIAKSGYVSRSAPAFFPLYPLLIHLGAMLFGSALVVGTMISLVAMAGGLYLLHRLARLDLSDAQARTTVLLIAFFPVSFYLSAAYTEALFLVLSVAAIYAARLDRWGWAAVIGGMAAATRSDGVLIALPLAVLYLYGPRAGGQLRDRARWWQPRYTVSASILWLGLVPAGLLAYMGYLGIVRHAPLAPFAAQAQWGRQFAGPFGAVPKALAILPADLHLLFTGTASLVGPRSADNWNSHNLIDLVFLAFAALGLIFSWRRVPFAYVIYSVALLAESLSYPTGLEPLMSLPRFVIPIFPLFMGWGAVLGERPRLRKDVLLASGALLVLFSSLWGIWAWIA
jgi:hypothetical protein